ncbi:gliotoxin biosynthesis protein [Colletotrichum truncatum]|uniref:Gliotoxin biosynthesis protein n=1 Tax=Colletotrichum truncatum TaxID=5467 RepID=A0ACC3Z3B3_COLTU|nr:gliotoxin biosynthesis protein [Colletotrichum truncatum]KAF6793109.1 gliotoxin biosynthesis protein [Colletotrichum truncatum]
MAATTTVEVPQEPATCLRRLQDLAVSYLSKPTPSSKPSYPPISSIPRTSDARLAAAAPDADPSAEKTVLYLAYGSNLCAETFLGTRGIRPVSQVNVSAPSLSLVFDLPGVPYREPCFANTAPRKVPELPNPGNPPKLPPIAPPLPPPATGKKAEEGTPTPDNLGWSKGLYGVVYEVTTSDYATIVATEGGGSSYTDIFVPCIPLPPRVSVPEKPPIDIPRPFLAHTLYSPAIPDAPPDDDDEDDDDNDDTKKPKPPTDPRKEWYYRFIKRPRRPDPEYAQPSARYLKLITDGAAEHELPDDYQRWLNSLQPYTVTTWGQRVAQFLLTLVFLPFLLFFLFLSKILAGKDGKLPLWLAVSMGVLFNVIWMAYDYVLKPVFGDGERTEEDKEDVLRLSRPWIGALGTDAEKNRLLSDW